MNNDTPFPENEQPSVYVYIIQAESGPIKIGLASNPAQRLTALQIANYDTLSLIYRIECKTVQQAQRIETALHNKYAEQCIRGEWFNIDPQRVIQDIEFTITFGKLFHSANVEQVNETSDTLEDNSMDGVTGYTKRMDARTIIKEFFEQHPEQMDIRLDELVDKIRQETGVRVGRTSIHNVRKELIQ